MTNIVVSIAFSQDGRKQVVKELALASATSTAVELLFTTTIKPPRLIYDPRSRKVNVFLEKHLHGIAWNDGVHTQSQVIPILTSFLRSSDILVCKGQHTSSFLYEALDRAIFDLDEWDVPHWTELPAITSSPCDYPHATECAAIKSLCYANWLKDNQLVTHQEFLP